MTSDKKYTPPVPDKADAVHALIRSGLGAIPFAGTAANELLGVIVTPTLDRRRSKWMEDVGEGLRILELKFGLVLEDLPYKASFIDIAIEASNIALRTSSEEKLNALKNALENSALPNAPEDSLQKLFLTYIDNLTVLHIRLLHLFDDPPSYIEQNGVSLRPAFNHSPAGLLEEVFPELREKRDFYDVVWRELYSRGLLGTEDVHRNTGDIFASRTTIVSRQFIAFIQTPNLTNIGN
jgi:hypothetical protein